MNGTFSISSLESLAKDVCAGPSQWSTRFPISKYPKALKELRERPETCLDLTFQHALLSLGYDLNNSRQVTVAKKLAGSELGWCAGAQLMTVSVCVVCARGASARASQARADLFLLCILQLDEEGVLCKA